MAIGHERVQHAVAENIIGRYPAGMPTTLAKFLYHLTKLQYENRQQRIPRRAIIESAQDPSENPDNHLPISEIGAIAVCFQDHKWDDEALEAYISGPKNSGQHGYATRAMASDPLTVKIALELLRSYMPDYNSRIARK